MARDRSIRATVFALALLMLPATQSAVAQEQAPLAATPIGGKWEVHYADGVLGGVSGVAAIDENAGRVEVTYRHPQSGEEHRLVSRRFQRDGATLTIELEGQSPAHDRDDGLNYPQVDIVVPEETEQVVARVGGNEGRKPLAPRAASDAKKVTLKLTLRDDATLVGTWEYRADPFTRRDRDGSGRIGEFERLPDGTGRQSGAEIWIRPTPEIFAAFALDSQTSWNLDLKAPNNPHRFQKDKYHAATDRRTIVIAGINLPDGDNRKAKLESFSEGVTYGRIIYPSSTFRTVPGHLRPFEDARAILAQEFAQTMGDQHGAKVANALDYIIVDATLREGIQPGFQEFSLNGVNGAWLLKFGNNTAQIRFVRRIDPDAVPRRTTDSFDFVLKNPDQSHSRGRLRVEVYDRPGGRSPAATSRITTVKSGELVKGNLKNAEVFFLRPDAIERASQAGLTFLRNAERNTTGKPIVLNPGPRKGQHGILLLKKDGSFEYEAFPKAWISEGYEPTEDVFAPETVRIAVRTELDLPRETIMVSVGRNGQVAHIGGWETIPAFRDRDDPRLYLTGPIALSKSAGGAGASGASSGARPFPAALVQDDELYAEIADPGLISIAPQQAKATVSVSPARLPGGFSYLWKDHLLQASRCYPELGEIDWDRSDYDFVATVEEDLNFAWWKVVSPITLLLSSETLQTDFQLGDHAAMLMMRQAFIQQLREKIKEYEKTLVADKETVGAFWLALAPYRRSVGGPQAHALTDVAFDINIAGPGETERPFLSTYWDDETNEARDYERPTDVPDWIIVATRQALKRYVATLKETLITAEELDICEVQDLVKLVGRNFQNVETWLIPRMMRLEQAGSLRWVPDYHGRLRLKQVASKFWQVQAHQRLSEQDTQHALQVASIITLPVSAAGATASLVLLVVNVGAQAYTEIPKYMESQAEIAFSKGTADILGFSRFERAKAEEYSGYTLAIGLLATAAGELANADLFKLMKVEISRGLKLISWARRNGVGGSTAALREAADRFRFGLRHLAYERGRKILESVEFDLSRLSRQMRQRDLSAAAEFLARALRRRAAGSRLSKSHARALERLEARNRKWKTALADRDPDLRRVVDTDTPRLDLPQLYRRGAGVVDNALAAGGRTRDEALAILRFSPQPTPEQFQRTLNARLKIVRDPQGFGVYDMTSPRNREIVELMKDRDWHIKITPDAKDPMKHYIKIRSPGKFEDELIRQFDPSTGTLSFIKGYRDHIPGHIDVGLPHTVSDKGFPAFLFAQLQFMNAMKIGYAGQAGHVLKTVRMNWVLNARTNVQLAWFKNTYFPNKTYAQLQAEGLLDEFILHTRSLDYAQPIVAMAGYRVKAARFGFFGEPGSLGTLGKRYKVASDGESWTDFLKRHGLTETDNGPPGLSIEIEVEPDPSAFRTAAANDNLPGSGGGSRSGPGETQRLGSGSTQRMGPGSTQRLGPGSTQRLEPGGTQRLGPGGRGDPPGDGGAGGPPNNDPPTQPLGPEDDPNPFVNELNQLIERAEARAASDELLYREARQGGREAPYAVVERAAGSARMRDWFAPGLRDAVENAVRAGIPNHYIARRIRDFRNAGFESDLVDAIRDLERLTIERNGYRFLDPGNAHIRRLSELIANTGTASATPEQIRALHELVESWEAQGMDFFEELARSGTMSRDEAFELMADAAEIEELRSLYRRTRDDFRSAIAPDEPPGQRPPLDLESMELDPDNPTWVFNRDGEIIGESEPFGHPTWSLNSRGEIVSLGNTQHLDMELPQPALDNLRHSLNAFNPLEIDTAMRAARAMVALGVDEEAIPRLMVVNARRLIGRDGRPSLARSGQLIAEAIMRHGKRTVTTREFSEASGLPGIMSEFAVRSAAMEMGLAPLPGGISPASLYPPVGY